MSEVRFLVLLLGPNGDCRLLVYLFWTLLQVYVSRETRFGEGAGCRSWLSIARQDGVDSGFGEVFVSIRSGACSVFTRFT